MKVKLQNNSVDQIFTGENKKKQVEFLIFFEVYVFFQWNFSCSMFQFFGSAITHTLQKIWGVAPGLFIFEVFTGLWLSTPIFCIKRLWLCQTFCPCIGFISEKYMVSQNNAKKWGTLHCWFPVQTMLKRLINVCTGVNLCSPFFSTFSETPCMKVGFDVRISIVWWMRAVSRRWEIPFLLSS